MSIPSDHHFLPKFYLAAWAIDPTAVDKKVVEYSRPHDKVVITLRAPRGTGKVKNLYSLPGQTDPLLREQVELQIMRTIDDRAGKVFKKLRDGAVKNLTAEDRNAWTTFIMSMIFRTPARLERINHEIRSTKYEWTDEDLAEFEALRTPDDPISPDLFMKAGSDDEISEARLMVMTKMCAAPLLGQGIIEMTWGVVELPKIDHGLLTSDEPVIMSNGMERGDGFVMLPLGPRHLFIAGTTREAVWSFASQVPKQLERAINDCIVAQAKNIVIGHRESHARFVEKRLGRIPVSGDGVLGRHTWVCP